MVDIESDGPIHEKPRIHTTLWMMRRATRRRC